MTSLIESILNHRSIRSYTNDPISSYHLDLILKATQAGPSSNNGQQATVIVITEQETKNKISQYSGNQHWIRQAPVFLLFLSDFYRAKLAAKKNNQELVIPSNIEGTLVGSIDVGIAVSQAMIASESLGLGTVCIGSIRNNPQGIIKLLDLPEYVYPLVGLCIGHPNQDEVPAQKPRLPQEAVIHFGKYNRDLQHYLDSYDKTIINYMKERGKCGVHDWTGHISSIYNKVYFPQVSKTLISQKYLCE